MEYSHIFWHYKFNYIRTYKANFQDRNRIWHCVLWEGDKATQPALPRTTATQANHQACSPTGATTPSATTNPTRLRLVHIIQIILTKCMCPWKIYARGTLILDSQLTRSWERTCLVSLLVSLDRMLSWSANSTLLCNSLINELVTFMVEDSTFRSMMEDSTLENSGAGFFLPEADWSTSADTDWISRLVV